MSIRSTQPAQIKTPKNDPAFLSDLSIRLRNIKSRGELFYVLHHPIRDYLHFKDSTLFVLNPEGTAVLNYFKEELVSEAALSLFNPEPLPTHLKKGSLPDTAYNEPVILPFQTEGVSEIRCISAYLNPETDPEEESGLVFNLWNRDAVFAQWVILPASDSAFNGKQEELLYITANLLGLALSNLMAEETISGKEAESETLQALNMDFASISDKTDLARIIRYKLKKLFDFGYHWLAVINDDHLTFSSFLQDSLPDVEEHACYHEAIKVRYTTNDKIVNKVLLSEDPVSFDLEQLKLSGNMPGYMQTLYNSGIKKAVMISLQVSCRIIGVWTICLNEKQQLNNRQMNYIKSISNQIALSISNILANEKVISQLREIHTYKLQLEEEKIYLKEEIETALNYSEMVGESAVMQKTFRLVAQVASSDSTVLILGETGTGKELIARAIHNSSPRKNKLMVKVNCAALPANLIESELFGHERGSFTGATERRLGKFELANKGTLFLDEIGEMPLDLQVKLLRALQEKEIERVGGRETIKVDVRIIAATNRDLEKEMAEGRFRSDLYYRLNIFPITLPALRERKEDIPSLALYFVQRFAKKAGKEIGSLNNRVIQELIQYNWPGNIRELEHLIERSILLTNGNTIKHIHLPNQRPSDLSASLPDEFVIRTIDENERDFILKTLRYCQGKIGGPHGAAHLLGVPTSTLNSKIKRLGIRKDHHAGSRA